MVELHLYHLSNKMLHTSGFLCQYTGIMKLDVMTNICAVLNHALFLWLSVLGSWSQWNTQFFQCRPFHTHSKCSARQVLSGQGHP